MNTTLRSIALILGFLVGSIIDASYATPGNERTSDCEYWHERDTIHIMEQAYVIGELQIRINELEVMAGLSDIKVYR